MSYLSYLIDIQGIIIVKQKDVGNDGLLLQTAQVAERLESGDQVEILVDITT
jgi:hypothetical protein